MTGSLLARYEPAHNVCTTIDSAARVGLGAITLRALALAGVRPRDTVQVTHTIDVSCAAWPVLWALDLLDAVVVATSGLRATPALRQLEFLRRFDVTTLCADDEVVAALEDAARDEGYDLTALSLRRIVLPDPAMRGARRQAIEQRWNASVCRVYATRSRPSWSAAECEASRRSGGLLGMHVLDDAALDEIEERAHILAGPCPCGLDTPRVKFDSED